MYYLYHVRLITVMNICGIDYKKKTRYFLLLYDQVFLLIH
jgi:hypothetical protein